MAEQRSFTLIKRHTAAVEKFDYFVPGIALALVGWLGGQSGQLRFTSAADIANILALLCLLLAAFAGLKRIESTITALRFNAFALLGEETAASRRQALRSRSILVDEQTGKPIDRSQLRASAEEQQRLANNAKDLMESAASNGQKWYCIRDGLLVAGLLLLILGRLLNK